GRIIDFLPGYLTNFIQHNPAALRVDGKRVRIAETICPYPKLLVAATRKWIAFRYAAVAGYSQKFAVVGIQILRIGAGRVVTNSNIQFAVQPEMNSPAVMICGTRQIIETQHQNFTVGSRHIAISGKAANPIMAWRGRYCVIDVHKLVNLEIRIDGDTKQTAFPCRHHGNLQERLGEQYAILNNPDRPGLLTNENAAIRQKRHGRRRAYIARHQDARKILR